MKVNPPAPSFEEIVLESIVFNPALPDAVIVKAATALADLLGLDDCLPDCMCVPCAAYRYTAEAA